MIRYLTGGHGSVEIAVAPDEEGLIDVNILDPKGRGLSFHVDHAPEKWWLNVNDEDDYVILDIRPRGGVEITMSVEVNAPERAVLVREPGARVDKRVPFAIGPGPGELSKETEGDVRGLLLDLIAWIEK